MWSQPAEDLWADQQCLIPALAIRDLLKIDIYRDEFERDLAMSIGDGFAAERVMPHDLVDEAIILTAKSDF